MIIFLCMGIFPIENVFANQNTRVVRIHKDKGDENVITKGAGNEAISKGEILRSLRMTVGKRFRRMKSKALSGEICQEHGVPESECSLCNPDMKIKNTRHSEDMKNY